MVALDRAGRDVESDGRRGVEIVAGPLVAHPRSAVAGSEVGEVGFRIVVAGDPDRSAAGLPLLAAGRPGVAAGFARRRNGEGPPQRLAGVHVVRRDEAAHAELAARGADQHLAVGDERRQRDVIALAVVLDDRRPDLAAGLHVERDEHRLRPREQHLVTVERDAAAGRVQVDHVGRRRIAVAPQQPSAADVGRDHLIARRRHEHHAVVDDRRRFVAAIHAGRHHPDRLELRDIGGRQLIERAVAPPAVVATDHQPVLRLGLFQAFRGDRRVRPQHFRNRRRFRSLGPGKAEGEEDAGGGDGRSSRHGGANNSAAASRG